MKGTYEARKWLNIVPHSKIHKSRLFGLRNFVPELPKGAVQNGEESQLKKKREELDVKSLVSSVHERYSSLVMVDQHPFLPE